MYLKVALHASMQDCKHPIVIVCAFAQNWKEEYGGLIIDLESPEGGSTTYVPQVGQYNYMGVGSRLFVRVIQQYNHHGCRLRVESGAGRLRGQGPSNGPRPKQWANTVSQERYDIIGMGSGLLLIL